MIKYVKGSVFDTDCDIIAHGCNCRGGFGKGVAYHMALLHPKAKQFYMQKYRYLHGWKLGDVQYVSSKGKIIANCATQDKYWKTGDTKEPLAVYWAIRSCMVKLFHYASIYNLTVAMPKIGAGLAGGDWDEIEKIIEEASEGLTVKVYVL